MSIENDENIRRKESTEKILRSYAAKNGRFSVLDSDELLKYIPPSPSSSSTVSPSGLYIVDVRTPEERNTSYIPSSISQLEFEKLDDKVTRDANLIISYCTIGLRSGNYCQELADKGYNIKKLKNGAGIISWSHVDGPLVRLDEKGIEVETKKVHCFGNEWKAMLNTKYDPVVFSTPKFLWFGIAELLKTFPRLFN